MWGCGWEAPPFSGSIFWKPHQRSRAERCSELAQLLPHAASIFLPVQVEGAAGPGGAELAVSCPHPTLHPLWPVLTPRAASPGTQPFPPWSLLANSGKCSTVSQRSRDGAKVTEQSHGGAAGRSCRGH